MPHTETTPQVFAELEQALDWLGFSSRALPQHPEAPLEQFMVLLEPDDQGHTLALRLSWLEDIVDLGMAQLQGGVGEHAAFHLEFHVPIPVMVPQEKRGVVALLAQLFSSQLLFGVIGYMPREGLYYKYCQPLVTRQLEADLTLEIIESITRFIHLFTAQLARLFAGVPLHELVSLPGGKAS